MLPTPPTEPTDGKQFETGEEIVLEIPLPTNPADRPAPKPTTKRDGVTAQNVERLTGMITERGRFRT